MVGNYDIDATVEMAKWSEESTDPDEQHICTLEEMYYDSTNGDVVLTFEDRDTGEFFDVSIAIKAVTEWNKMLDSMPRTISPTHVD